MRKYKKAGVLQRKPAKKRMPKGRRFKPGQSGNPNGRPKGSLNMKTLIERVWSEEVTDNGNPIIRGLKAVKAIADKAERGDVRAFNELADRLEGKPKQQYEHEVSGFEEIGKALAEAAKRANEPKVKQ